MPAQTGNNLYAQWIYTFGTTGVLGTVTINTYYRSFKPNRSGKMVESSSGNATYDSWVFVRGQGGAKATFVSQDTDGTIPWNAFEPGNRGTLTWAEFGTANAKPKHTAPLIVKSGDPDIPYDGLIIWNVEWEGDGAPTHSVWS
jgi:hypothetical protein